jgi:hypothetical protein
MRHHLLTRATGLACRVLAENQCRVPYRERFCATRTQFRQADRVCIFCKDLQMLTGSPLALIYVKSVIRNICEVSIGLTIYFLDALQAHQVHRRT